jgi:uncharacterized membrane protein YdbT with pleckstrin-like domain
MVGFHLKGFLWTVAAGVAAGLISATVKSSVQVAWVALTVLAIFAVVLARGAIRRRRLTYTITSERLTIRTGLLSRELHECRLERVQNVGFRQSMLERALRVGTVDFDTAGSAEYAFSFVGVSEPAHVAHTVNRALRDRRPAQDRPGGALG